MDDIATYFPAPTDYGGCRSSMATRLRFRATMIVRWRLCLRPWPRLRSRVASAFSKVLTGTLSRVLSSIDARTRKGGDLAHLYVMCGRDMTEVGHAYAGDIIVAPGCPPRRAIRSPLPVR